jgi:hypothetical protein
MWMTRMTLPSVDTIDELAEFVTMLLIGCRFDAMTVRCDDGEAARIGAEMKASRQCKSK